MINTLEYLLDEKGVLDARSREVKLRLLDGIRATEEKFFWQLINIVLPLLLLIVSGIGFYYWRKRSFTR